MTMYSKMDNSSLSKLTSRDTDLCLFSTPPDTPRAVDKLEKSLQEVELKTLERTPRKPANPRQTPVRENKDDSILISFKFVQSTDRDSLQLTPELSITTITPVSLARKSRAKRRLWSGECEPLEYIDLDIKQKKCRLSDELLEFSVPKSKTATYSSLSDPEEDDEKYLPIPLNNDGMDSDPPQVEVDSETKYYSLKCSRYSTKSKTCASCNTKKTPLWRDSDDGTPYCNACGIRFKKYRVRCSVCLYIPRKDEKTNNCCFMCGSQLVRCRFSGQSNY